MGNETGGFLKENWQWLVTGLGIPILGLLLGVVKMCFKYLFPINIKVFAAKMDFRIFKGGETDGSSTTIIYAGQEEAYLSITLIRRARLDEFHEFCIEIPQLRRTLYRDCADLVKWDTSPQTIEFSLGLLSHSVQEEWQSNLAEGVEIIIKIKAGWRQRCWPITKQIKLGVVNRSNLVAD